MAQSSKKLSFSFCLNIFVYMIGFDFLFAFFLLQEDAKIFTFLLICCVTANYFFKFFSHEH